MERNGFGELINGSPVFSAARKGEKKEREREREELLSATSRYQLHWLPLAEEAETRDEEGGNLCGNEMVDDESCHASRARNGNCSPMQRMGRLNSQAVGGARGVVHSRAENLCP